MSRMEANIWGRVLIRNKLITQEKWEFVAAEYTARSSEESIGQMLVDAGYINVKQMQQIAKVVDQVLAKAQPEAASGSKPDKPKPPAPAPVADEPDDDEGGIELAPQRDDEKKIEIRDLSEARPMSASSLSGSPSGPHRIERRKDVDELDDEDSYDLAGPVPTDDDGHGFRVADVDWHADGGDVEEYKADDSERISLEGDDDDDEH